MPRHFRSTGWSVMIFPPKVTVSVPVRVPVAVGVNTTLMSHFCPPGTATEQLFVSEKSPAIETAGEVGTSPKLPTCTSTGLLTVPTF